MSLSLRQAESYVRVAERWGVQGYPGGMIPGIATLFSIWFREDDAVLRDAEPAILDEIAANLAFGKANMGKGDGRIQPMMSPHATDTQTPATMNAQAAAARELGTGIHVHLAQGAREAEAAERRWGMSPAQFCADYGLMNGPFFGAHLSAFGAHLSAFDFGNDADLMIDKNGVYAHCPSAGGAGGGAGGGTQPYPEALATRMGVNIGIDTHSNDFVENLKLAVLCGQARHSLISELDGAVPMKAPTVWDAVEGATRVAADGLRRPDLGRIKPGAKADLCSINVSGTRSAPGHFTSARAAEQPVVRERKVRPTRDDRRGVSGLRGRTGCGRRRSRGRSRWGRRAEDPGLASGRELVRPYRSVSAFRSI